MTRHQLYISCIVFKRVNIDRMNSAVRRALRNTWWRVTAAAIAVINLFHL